MSPEAKPAVAPTTVLDRAGISYEVIQHRPIRTQQDIEQHLDIATERSVKTLVFEVPVDRIVFAVIPGPSRINYRGLAAAVQVPRAQLRPAGPATLDSLGMEPGGVTPIHDRDGVVMVFDATVPEMGSVYCGSGRADQTLAVNARDLLRIAKTAMVASITR
jgi:Cys-tRNA(Pro)/Cys-tRNA(Cys) deacylase